MPRVTPRTHTAGIHDDPSLRRGGSVFVLDISFHKGDSFIERVGFPEGPDVVCKALYDLLESCEAR